MGGGEGSGRREGGGEWEGGGVEGFGCGCVLLMELCQRRICSIISPSKS